ncbi:MAG: hypothetical protein H8E27_12445 [Verrucomicrobia subdivision 3 bacterium]|nr:hypothetical protein [Limisphaerales bacterium]
MEVCVLAQTPTPNSPKLDIRLTQKDYKTVPENFEAVCRSAAMGFARHFPERKFKPIRIEKANHQYPVKLDRRGPKGETLVMLSVDDGFGWAQIAYQFSHEFTHIVINHDRPRSGANHWINEAFCEAISCYSLKVMAKEWETHPPYGNWKSYAKHLNSYADRVIAKGKTPEEVESFAVWFEKNEKALRLGKRYPKYDLYKYAGHQFYQVIQKNPKHLVALLYLNEGLKSQGLNTRDYLARWKSVLPKEHQPFADQIAAQLGLVLPDL